MPSNQPWPGQFSPPPLPPRLRDWTCAQILIAINIGVFAIDALTDFAYVTPVGGFEVAKLQAWQIWRFISFQFLHAGPWHIAMNMIALYFFGPVVESVLGKVRFALFYLACGVGGGFCYLLLFHWKLLHVTDTSMLVGASASVMGVMMAAARLNPHMQVMMVFPPLPLRIRTLVLIYLAVALLTLISPHGVNQGGEAAHLGGLIVGAALSANRQWLTRQPSGKNRRKFWKPGDPSVPFFRDRE